MPAISRGPNLPPATTHTEKCDTLCLELYQPPLPLPREFRPDLINPHPDDLPFHDVTDEEVREALFATPGKTAPGPSQINYQVIRWAWQIDDARKYIILLMRRCLQVGYHPKSWRRATAVALRKPRKPDYSNPRAYRLITLLECLGKVLERIVARRLTYLAGKHNLIPSKQFGGRTATNTTDAVLAFTNDIQAAWNHGMVTTSLTFDIKGYFDFVNHNRLLCELRRKKIPLPMVKWVASFLSQREAAICIDGIRGDMKPVENGIPQGSPISPILSAFYSAELIEIFEDPTHPDAPTTNEDATQVTLFMYVDDENLFVSSKSLKTNITILKTAYSRAEEWLYQAGLSPDLSKRELMHYSRRPRDPSPAIAITDRDGLTRTIAPTKSVRWLGVYFDRRLLFNEHVNTLASRAEAVVGRMAMLANTVRGLSQIHLRHLYRACIIPVMTYASPVWWTGKKLHYMALERVQRRALRLICAAFRTTPITALEIEASIPPVQHLLDTLNQQCAVRFNKLDHRNPTIERLPDSWRNNKPARQQPPLPPRPRGTHKTTRLQELSKLTSPNNEQTFPFLTPPWRRTTNAFNKRLQINAQQAGTKEDAASNHQRQLVLLQSPEHLLVYSDGSMKNIHGFRRVGAGAVGYHSGNEIFNLEMGLGSRAEVFDGELAALHMGFIRAFSYARNHQEIKHIHLFADNKSAIQTIDNPQPRPGQLRCYLLLKKIHEFLDQQFDHRVSISWIPGHRDIKGNEKADELAKKAVGLASQESPTLSNARRRSKEKLLYRWIQDWRNTPTTGRFAPANRIPPSLKPTKWFISTKREIFGRLVQCRTGHGYIGDYYRRFIQNQPTTCPCGEPFQTRDHIIAVCKLYDNFCEDLRLVSRDISLPEILGTPKGIEALAKFLELSGAFTKTGQPRQPLNLPTFEDEPEVNELVNDRNQNQVLYEPAAAHLFL